MDHGARSHQHIHSRSHRGAQQVMASRWRRHCEWPPGLALPLTFLGHVAPPTDVLT
jgi:hypothetical protein